MDKLEIITRLDYLMQQGGNCFSRNNYVDPGLMGGFRTSCLSFINSLYGENHIFYKDFYEYTKFTKLANLTIGINIIKSIKTEIENGWFFTYKELVSAEVFSDFLDMSKYLLDEKYKDAAAVMIGSVLEEHLRFLCNKNNIEVTYITNDTIKPKKADVLNHDLCKANVYGLLYQKNITAWLDLRNNAAHGKYSEYSKEQVDLMYQGVLNFMIKNQK